MAGQFPDRAFTEHRSGTAYFMALDNHKVGQTLGLYRQLPSPLLKLSPRVYPVAVNQVAT